MKWGSGPEMLTWPDTARVKSAWGKGPGLLCPSLLNSPKSHLESRLDSFGDQGYQREQRHCKKRHESAASENLLRVVGSEVRWEGNTHATPLSGALPLYIGNSPAVPHSISHKVWPIRAALPKCFPISPPAPLERTKQSSALKTVPLEIQNRSEGFENLSNGGACCILFNRTYSKCL